MNKTANWWQSHYGAAIPVAHILRQQIPDRWFRIHSLPQSKRYAETPDEYLILLKRHNTIATEVLGSRTRCLICVGRYSEHPEPDIDSQKLPQIEGATFTLLNSGKPPDSMSVWCAMATWSSGSFDSVIKDVADYREANILFASLETAEAYAPYDGGADLFLSSTKRRDEMKQRYNQWLSKSPEGL